AGFFYASCAACLMIAINRVAELMEIRPLLPLYKDVRTWYMMVIPTTYSLLLVAFTPITMLNSEAHVLSIDLGFNNGIEYTSSFLIANNVFCPLLSSVLYVIMISSVLIKR
ncbi:hypothetical protein PMAYCL1PPCAC_20903, partial [Pristionchus mayeri]